MIRINLLATESGKKGAAAPARAKSGPSPAPWYLLLVLLYAAAVAGFGYSYLKVSKSREEAKAASDQVAGLRKKVEAERKEFEANNALMQEVEARYAVIEALGPHNRIFWSEKINMVAKARMNLAVYLTKMELTERIDERETPESVARREEWRKKQEENKKKGIKEPKAVTQPVINQTLHVHGIAYGNDPSQRLRQISSFYNNLRDVEWMRESGELARFSDRMAKEYGPLPQKIAVVAGVEVMRFGFTVQADAQLDQTGGIGKAAAAGSGAKGGS